MIRDTCICGVYDVTQYGHHSDCEFMGKDMAEINQILSVFLKNGKLSDTTKGFVRDSARFSKENYAEILVPAGLPFPTDMLRRDCCTIVPGFELFAKGVYKQPRYVTVKKNHKYPWTVGRWESFSCKLEEIC